MTQTPAPPPVVDLPPGVTVRLTGYDPIGTVMASDAWWDTLQQRGVATDQQVLVEWSGDITVRTWEKKVHLEVVPTAPDASPAKKTVPAKKAQPGGQQ